MPAQTGHLSSVTSMDSVNCPKLTGPCLGGNVATDIRNTTSTDVQPILIEDDDIQVVQVSHPQSAPREDSQTAATQGTSEGRSAEDPIVINDDDLHQASTNNAQNKIKIERRPNGIVLRLFRDNNGQMEDLSQLGMEVRKDMWYCCRCEYSFANWQDFLSHISDELHTIFNFTLASVLFVNVHQEGMSKRLCRVNWLGYCCVCCRWFIVQLKNQKLPHRVKDFHQSR